MDLLPLIYHQSRPTVWQPSMKLSPQSRHIVCSRLHSIMFKKDLLLRHLDVYFEYLHPISCYGFLHPAATYRAVELNQLSPYLAVAICSVTATILDPEGGAAFAARCNEEVELYLCRSMKTLDVQVLKLV